MREAARRRANGEDDDESEEEEEEEEEQAGGSFVRSFSKRLSSPNLWFSFRLLPRVCLLDSCLACRIWGWG